MLYQEYSFVYTEREFSKTNVLDLLFLFIFLSRCINSNNFELIHPRKNIKNTLTLSINVRLKVTRVLCILTSSGYLGNFKILSILTLTFNCGFPCALGLVPKTPQM